MPDPILSGTAPHHDAEALLPWYATGRLEGDDLALVEAHVSSCAHCRRQLAFEQRMVGEFAALTPEIESGWQRLKQRLDAPRSRGARGHIPAGAAAGTWHMLTRPAVLAVAFAQLALVIVAGAALLSLTRPAYRALGSAAPPRSANLIAMFRPETTESQLRTLLRRTGATLVDGPTPSDAYLLSVAPQSRQSALIRLRADRHVLLAQPIDGAAS